MSDTRLTENDARAFIAPFYDALNAPSTKDVRTLIESIATPQWRSHSANAVSKGREELIQQIIGFGKGVPDLAWTIDEVLVAGNRVTVRSEATGTPAGDFMGVPHAGRSFRIMTIDIHTVEGGKLVRADHVEDWASAIRQLRG